ncbi:MAG: hypothetical protein NTW64_01885 [Candidatus Omnitrophica bacterium]|nr:hypothetical protein [Candidatus Omnitrophota bacterium]
MRVLTKLNTLQLFSAGILVIYLFLNIKNTYHPQMQALRHREIKFPQLLPEVSLARQELFKSKPLFKIYVNKSQLREKENFILLGVSVGKKNLAMIRDTVGNKDYYCTEGDSVADFKVKSILSDKVILESDKDSLILTP